MSTFAPAHQRTVIHYPKALCCRLHGPHASPPNHKGSAGLQAETTPSNTAQKAYLWQA